MRRRLTLPVSILLVLSIIVVLPSVANGGILRLASTGPVLHVNPTSIPIGGTVTFSGGGFDNTTGDCWSTMYLDPVGIVSPTGSCFVNGSGEISGSLTVGVGTTPQVYTATLQGASASFVVFSMVTASTTTTTIISTTSTATSTTTWVSVPSIRATPSYALAGSSIPVTVTGSNFVGTYFVLDTGLVALASPSGAISSGAFSAIFNVNPSAPVNSYTLVVHTNGGSADSASCPFLILPSTTLTSTIYNSTVTRTSTSISNTATTSTVVIPTTATSTVTTVTVSSTSTTYTTTTTLSDPLTVYPYTVTQSYGATVTMIPTTTITIYGQETVSRATGVTTVDFEQTVIKTLQNTVTLGGGTTTTFQTQTQNKTVTKVTTATTITTTASETVSPPTVTTTIYTSSQTEPPPTSELDIWTIAGIIAAIAIALVGAVMVLFWRRRRSKAAADQADQMGKMPGRAFAASVAATPPATPIVIPVQKETEKTGHVALAPTADDGSISCKSCGGRIEKGKANCRFCRSPRSFSEQEETPEHQEETLKRIQELTKETKPVSKIGPLKDNGTPTKEK